MEEDIVKEVIKKFFKNRREIIIPQKGAGPDFLKEGIAIEAKGVEGITNNMPRSLEQITNYAFKYTKLELVFPIDGVTIRFLYSLYAIEGCTRYTKDIPRERLIKTYLVCSLDDKEYAVLQFDSIDTLLEAIKKEFNQYWAGFVYAGFKPAIPALDNQNKIEVAIERVSDIDKTIKEILKNKAKDFGCKVKLE